MLTATETPEVNERTGAIMRRISQLSKGDIAHVSYVQSQPTEAVALQWDGTAQSANVIAMVCGKDVTFYRKVAGIEVGNDYMITVETAHGPVGVEVGCWLLWSGSEWYPVDAQTFVQRWHQVPA